MTKSVTSCLEGNVALLALALEHIRRQLKMIVPRAHRTCIVVEVLGLHEVTENIVEYDLNNASTVKQKCFYLVEYNLQSRQFAVENMGSRCEL